MVLSNVLPATFRSGKKVPAIWNHDYLINLSQDFFLLATYNIDNRT